MQDFIMIIELYVHLQYCNDTTLLWFPQCIEVMPFLFVLIIRNSTEIRHCG